MMIATRGFLFATAVVLFLAADTPVEAQEVCWWSNTVENQHGFIFGGRHCPEDEKLPGLKCVKCEEGKRKEHEGCHPVLMPGGADHEACDDGTAALVALTEIRDALGGDDVTMLASALMKERAGVSAEFVPEGGRIDLILACDPYKPFRTIPVLPEVRRALEGELQQTDRGEFTAAEPAR